MFVQVANVFARFSCPMWMPIGPVRLICRKTYRWLAENPYFYRRALRKKGLTEDQLADLSRVRFDVDTYPPLYANLEFAPWEEVADPDDPKRYNLISSRGREVVRHAAGYCAHKIFELTGQYPRHLVNKRYDSKEWVEFLAGAGYNIISDRPHAGHHYVGVIPGEGEFGQVVWFGKIGRDVSAETTKTSHVPPREYSDGRTTFRIITLSDDNPDADYFCSTYCNFEFEIRCIRHDDQRVVWVQID